VCVSVTDPPVSLLPTSLRPPKRFPCARDRGNSGPASIMTRRTILLVAIIAAAACTLLPLAAASPLPRAGFTSASRRALLAHSSQLPSPPVESEAGFFQAYENQAKEWVDEHIKEPRQQALNAFDSISHRFVILHT
jgi:hypothetical protein